MSEMDNLLNELKNMQHTSVSFDKKTIWDGIAQRKDFSDMGFKSQEEFEEWINNNPYFNL